MMPSLRVAAIQLNAGTDRSRNLEVAERLLQAATTDGARLAVLPEMFNLVGDPDVLRQGAESLDGPTIQWARALAQRHAIWLVAGSITERAADADRHFNTSCLIGPDGGLHAAYRKIHLFDCDVAGATYHESATVLPGEEIVVAEAAGMKLGMSICYDLRFPELFRILALGGARTIALPAAFTERTGRDHWEPLLRARAIENQVFLIAADQLGGISPRLRWYGRSAIVDPWGTILAQAADRETYVIADLDFTAQDRVRAELPSLANRRPAVYRWP